MTIRSLTILLGGLLWLSPHIVLAAETLPPACAITEALNPGGPTLRFPAQLVQAAYLYALCDLLEETYFDTVLREQDLQFRQQQLGAEKTQQVSPEEHKITERLLALERSEIEARKRHVETLAKTLEEGKTTPFREGGFWAAWHQEQERYAKLSVAMSKEALALSDELDKATSPELPAIRKDLAGQVRSYRDRVLSRKTLTR